MTATVVMARGTASHVGKSVVTAGLCRLLQRRGVRVAPFKALNLSLNAAVTSDGEIARSTAVQAAAAGSPRPSRADTPQIDPHDRWADGLEGALDLELLFGRCGVSLSKRVPP